MIYIDGINLHNTRFKHVTINGSHVYAKTLDGKPTDVRRPEMDTWYDDKHQALVTAYQALEAALRNL